MIYSHVTFRDKKNKLISFVLNVYIVILGNTSNTNIE